MNMGAYSHVSPRLQTAMLAEDRHLHDHIPYAGRGPSASTATGFGSVHAQEQVQPPCQLLPPDTSRSPLQLSVVASDAVGMV